jgi:hypothetical protein
VVPAATLHRARLRDRLRAHARPLRHPATIAAIALVAIGVLLEAFAPTRSRPCAGTMSPTSPAGLAADFAQHDIQPR